MNRHFVLNEQHEPVEADLMTWAKWFQDVKARCVGYTEFDGGHVSTVFLGLDHNFAEVGPPLLFETMIFGGANSEYQERYSTWAEAEAGHLRAVGIATPLAEAK